MNNAPTNPLRPIVLKPDEGAILAAFGDTIQEKLGPEATNKAFSLGLLTSWSRNGLQLAAMDSR